MSHLLEVFLTHDARDTLSLTFQETSRRLARGPIPNIRINRSEGRTKAAFIYFSIPDHRTLPTTGQRIPETLASVDFPFSTYNFPPTRGRACGPQRGLEPIQISMRLVDDTAIYLDLTAFGTNLPPVGEVNLSAFFCFVARAGGMWIRYTAHLGRRGAENRVTPIKTLHLDLYR
jgi:hypothetical protein